MSRAVRQNHRAGFSLIEVLIAIAILGVGLIMVATIFPVAATWTRQSAEETVAAQVAQNAVNTIKTKLSTTSLIWGSDSRYVTGSLVVYNGAIYKAKTAIAPNGTAPNSNSNWQIMNGTDSDSVSHIAVLTDLRPAYQDTYDGTKGYAVGATVLYQGYIYTAIKATTSNDGNDPTKNTYWTKGVEPDTSLFPLSERAYAFGTDKPYPATTPDKASYFWTAFFRASTSASSNEVVAYIFVFRRGSADQTFTTDSSGGTEIPGSRLTTDGTDGTTIPRLMLKAFAAGTHSTGDVTDCVPPMGYMGVGLETGTVFRQTIAIDSSSKAYGAPSVPIKSGGESVVYVPAADNTTGSPLVYVYQTKLSF